MHAYETKLRHVIFNQLPVRVVLHVRVPSVPCKDRHNHRTSKWTIEVLNLEVFDLHVEPFLENVVQCVARSCCRSFVDVGREEDAVRMCQSLLAGILLKVLKIVLRKF